MRKKEPVAFTSRPKLKPERPVSPPMLVLLHKPFRVLCQFSPSDDKATLADVLALPDDAPPSLRHAPYPAGRLDHDSEGLLLLTNHGPWQARVADPRFRLRKTYHVQVEGIVTDEALARLLAGVALNDGPARAVAVRRPDPAPVFPPREPPVRYRASIPTDWLEIVLDEGRNRQVRRMTAAVGLPTLRLVRVGIGPWTLDGLAAGESRLIAADEAVRTLGEPRQDGRRRRHPDR